MKHSGYRVIVESGAPLDVEDGRSYVFDPEGHVVFYGDDGEEIGRIHRDYWRVISLRKDDP